MPPLPGEPSPEDTQPIPRPHIEPAPAQFITGGFTPVSQITGQHHISDFEPEQADEAPTLPPEHMPGLPPVPPPVMHAPQLPPPSTGRLTTGQLNALEPQHDPFMTGRMNAINQTPPGQHLRDAFIEEPDRISYGIWGAAVGCIFGIIFGVLNALFEGVYPSDNQGPLIIFTLFGLCVGGAVSAAAPRKVSALIRELFFFYR